MSMTILNAVVLAATALLPSLGESQVKQLPDPSKFERKTDLSKYKTYHWSRDQVPAKNMANHIRIVNAIQDAMKERGYRIDTIDPDVRIRYHLTLKESVKGNAKQQRSVWDEANSTVQIDFSREKLAEFKVELVEAESRFVLWESKGNYLLGTPDRAEKQIHEAITDIFKRYPAKD